MLEVKDFFPGNVLELPPLFPSLSNEPFGISIEEVTPIDYVLVDAEGVYVVGSLFWNTLFFGRVVLSVKKVAGKDLVVRWEKDLT